MPVAETVPPDADQLTPVLLLPVTLAVNCCVPPACMLADVGLTLTATKTAGCTLEGARVQPAIAKMLAESVVRMNA